MKPYFETKFGRLYHGNCLEIMPRLKPVELVIADPLYPKLRGNTIHCHNGVAPRKTTSKTISSSQYDASMDWISSAWNMTIKAIMIFCSYHFVAEVPQYIPGEAINLLTWHKRNAPNPVNNRPKYTTEFIWLFQKEPGLNWRNIDTSMFDIPNLTAGCITTGERILNDDKTAAHPMQKPLALINRLLLVNASTVMDPFLGSGTTAIACERLKRQWIGIEIIEKYCEMAAKRIEREIEQLKLFEPVTKLPLPKQTRLF